ncbi:MAG: cobalamin-dependent protein, partial [Candidatus Methylomirabilis sp.]|nr:cobalamin-dependent protein [Deltaproteobacteria bacterium]
MKIAGAKKKIVLVRARPGAYSGVLAARFPLALLRVASFLHEDYEVVLIDQAKDRGWARRLREELTTGEPVVMGVGTMTGPQLKGALEASVLTREVAPKVKVVWGGVHPSLFPTETARDPRVDFAV